MDTRIDVTDTRARALGACATLIVLAALMAPAAGAGAAGPTPGGSTRPARPARATASPAPSTATADGAKDEARDTHEGLKGGQEGTVFRSLTVEGEDRVHIEFDRPALDLALDPAKAPGLDWGSAEDVLDRMAPDPMQPLVASSAAAPEPYLARPWLDGFATGAVARFHPDVEGVDRWTLMVADSRGRSVASFSGKGTPPRELAWDGRATDGTLVTPGLTYSYVFEAFDRAGNKRHIVGPGFTVPAYRLETREGPMFSLTGARLAMPAATGATHGAPAAPDAILEIASAINQWPGVTEPLKVTATARSYDQADGLASGVVRALGPLVIGGSARLQSSVVVQPDAPQDGTVTIAPAR